MSPIVLTLFVVGSVAGQVPAPADPCPPDAARVLAEAEVAVLAGESTRSAELLRRASDDHRQCQVLGVASMSLHGWDAAREAARVGGTDDALAIASKALSALEPAPRSGVTPAAYAAAIVHAAIAASQDEREEMRVWIEGARTLSSRLALIGEPAVWPLPIDLAEGQLWLSVDDYEQAEAAFGVALAGRESAAALAGLARARDRRGNRAGACAAFKRVAAVISDLYRHGAIATEARGYAILCEP